jgi:hypothetical protein
VERRRRPERDLHSLSTFFVQPLQHENIAMQALGRLSDHATVGQSQLVETVQKLDQLRRLEAFRAQVGGVFAVKEDRM